MNNKHFGTIYQIINIQNNKSYIGQTTQEVNSYINSHFTNALRNKKANKLFYNAIRKYGKENFKIKILGFCNSKQELNEAEIESIYFFRTYGSDGKNQDSIYGYNLTKGGDGGKTTSQPWNKGLKKENNESLSQASKTFKTNYKKENHPNFGKTLSEAHCKKLSNGMKGIPKSQEHKDKLSEANFGKKRTIASRIKQANSTRGIKQKVIQCPYCGKFGGTAMNRWHFENCKIKGKVK